MMSGLPKKLVREPLLHFLVLGAAIFAFYSLVSKNSSGEPGKIVITQGQLASMWDTFAMTRQREPSREEWEGLIRERVRQEVYYREALALGLDKDDLIIRRRLQQKMEFASDDAAKAQPTDDELRAYMQTHTDSFRTEQRFTFRQVFLSPEKHGKDLARYAAQLQTTLNQAGSKPNISTFGDSIMLDHEFVELRAGEIARQFGDGFAAALSRLPVGQWEGPIGSAYGVHLVLVSARTEGRVAELSDMRDAVRREWEEARRLEASEKSYQQLLKGYTVTIEAPALPKEKTVASRN